MAIKFSQFVVKTSSSDLSHIVGYNGVDNIQITPTNFLNSALTGTPGQVLFFDTTGVASSNALFFDTSTKNLGVGTNSPDRNLVVSGVGSSASTYIKILGDTSQEAILELHADNDAPGDRWRVVASNSGKLQFRSNGSNVYTVTSTENVGIGTTNPTEKLEVAGNIKIGDSLKLILGTSENFNMFHTGTDVTLQNFTGDFNIVNKANDKDIIFQSDDGSGGTTEYFKLDGSAVFTRFSKDARFSDNVRAEFGDSGDLDIYHDATDSFIENNTGDLNIVNYNDDKDILFKSDDGSGGVATYFRIDGGQLRTEFELGTQHLDNIIANFGSSSDLKIYHNGTDSFIQNGTGDLEIMNSQDDGDIVFKSDDGSGGVTEYFRVDGGQEKTLFIKNTEHQNGIRAQFGNSGNFSILHDGSNSFLINDTGDLYLRNNTDDRDIIFQSDDGSGGLATYFFVDGSAEQVKFSKNTEHQDNVQAQFGAGSDLKIYHDGSGSYTENATGHLYFMQRANDQDMIFMNDDGSGGDVEYFKLDGSLADGNYTYTTRNDGGVITFGNSLDLRIWRDPIVNDSYIRNYSDDLIIESVANDKDIVFKSDDGSGGTTDYFVVDGGLVANIFYKRIKLIDNVQLQVGSNPDLLIYHDGSHSYIEDLGTGQLRLKSNSQIQFLSDTNDYHAKMIKDGAVELYHDNSKKFETTSTGVKITGVSEYADNAAAIAGGLTTGDVYRTGDLLKIVH